MASALLATRARFGLPREPLSNLVDARTFDLYADPMPGLRQLEGYCGETSSVLFRLAALVLRDGREPGGASVAGHGGVAYALTGLLRALPWHAAQGRCYVPTEMLEARGASLADVLARRATPALRETLADLRAEARRKLDLARAGLDNVHRSARPAFLPFALIEPALARMERRGYEPFTTRVDPPLWRRQWALWRGARDRPDVTRVR